MSSIEGRTLYEAYSLRSFNSLRKVTYAFYSRVRVLLGMRLRRVDNARSNLQARGGPFNDQQRRVSFSS